VTYPDLQQPREALSLLKFSTSVNVCETWWLMG